MFDVTKVCEKILKSEKGDYYYSKTFQRHLDDLTNLDTNKYKFNNKLANAYLFFISNLKHYKGSKFAGQKIKLEDWQIASFGILFGWMKKNSEGNWVRRFNTADFFIARKNGKSLIASAIILADIFVLREPGAEMIIGATKREQAEIVWEGVYQMIQSHPDLRKLFGKTGKILYLKKDISTKIMPLSRDAGKTFDGANVQIGCLDELAAHADTSILDVVKSSMGARENPLMLYISTAGFNLASPMKKEVDYSCQILDGALKDENYFCFIAKKEKGVDAFSIEAMKQTNPNIGVSVSLDFLQKEAKEAKLRPEKLTNYLTKHINEFVNSSELFVAVEDWNECKVSTLPDLTSATRMIVSADLSVSDDFTAICTGYLFPNNQIAVTFRFVIPDNKLRERERDLKIPLQSWVNEGLIETSVGKSVDLDYVTNIVKDELDKAITLNIPVEFAYDPYKAKTILAKLENDYGFKDTISVYQGFATQTEPLARSLAYIKQQDLIMTDNPVMDWMVSNVSVIYDNYGNYKIDKSDRTKKIDGYSAMISVFYGFIPYIDENQETDIIWI